jgi:integrase/recombinase XerD
MMQWAQPKSAATRADATTVRSSGRPIRGVGTLLSTSFDAGDPLRDVQEAASHADPRTTMRYDRARGSLDRHATYIVAAYIAGAAR